MVIIQTERLVIRPFELSDLKTTHEYASDIENTIYMMHLPNNTEQETKKFLVRVTDEWAKEIPQFYEFAISLADNHIGGVSVSLDESRQIGELGWIIHKAYQCSGYATEAAIAVLDFAVNNLKVKKIIAHCDYRNEASIRVMQKIGLVLESTDGKRRYKDTEQDIQELMYSLLTDKTSD